jgi:hypothetical protein
VIVLLFIREHWRALLVLLVLVSMAGGGFILGRRSVKCDPSPAIVTSSEKLFSEDSTLTTKATQTEKTRTVTTSRDRITTHPDGTVTQEHVERHAGSQEQAHVQERTQEARVELREVEKRVEVPAPLPKWRVGALVGVDLTHPPLLSDGRVGVGAIVERRLVGPISVGAYGTHTGSVGVLLTVEF